MYVQSIPHLPALSREKSRIERLDTGAIGQELFSKNSYVADNAISTSDGKGLKRASLCKASIPARSKAKRI